MRKVKYQSFIRDLNRFAFLDNFVSLGREFQIFEPKKLVDLSKLVVLNLGIERF